MATERRRKQIAQRIRERVAHLLLFELKDPRASFVTVTEVDINGDLSIAKVRYTVYGDRSSRSKVAGMLKHAHGFLRTEVAHALQLRTAPELVFEYDEGVERAERIESILREVLPEDGAEPAGTEEG